MYVKPAPNPLAGEKGQPVLLRVRDPDLGDFLPDTGRQVPDSSYWTRRLRDRDVVTATPVLAQPDTVPVKAPAVDPAAPIDGGAK